MKRRQTAAADVRRRTQRNAPPVRLLTSAAMGRGFFALRPGATGRKYCHGIPEPGKYIALFSAMISARVAPSSGQHCMTTKLFSELGLSPEMLKAIDKLGFEQAAPIQAEAIPILMQGRDVVGQSQTGSGKTAAFVVP